MNNDLDCELKVAQKIAREAGKLMLAYFDDDLQTQTKEDGSPVTIADIKINSLVIKLLNQKFPDDGVIGEEESNTAYGLGRKWFCDPIDGTKAFVWGVPTSVFSLGLVIDGKPRLGVVFDPFLDRMYTAIKSKGSFCNGKSLHVSDDKLVNGIFAATADVTRISEGIPYIKKIAHSGVKIATFSSAIRKSVLIASGKFVGYIEDIVKNHDIAAVQVIVEEAGGVVTGLDGKPLDYLKPFQGVVVSNGIVHDDLVKAING